MSDQLDVRSVRNNFNELCRQKELSTELPQPPLNRRLSKCGVTSERCRVEGNEKFKQREFEAAIKFYNGSLRYAPPGSKDIPLAYGNRSAVYCEMGKYALAIENIKLARKNGFPSEKLTQLNVREEKCKKLMETFGPDKGFDVSSFVKLSHPPNKKIPFIADCLELHKNEKYGRHVVTTKDLKTGDVIAIESPVFAWPNDLMDTTCFFCTETKSGSLIPCFHCSEIMYCSEKCQLKDADYHFNSEFSKKGYGLPSQPAIKMMLESSRLAGGFEELFELLKDSKDKTIFDFDFSNPDDPNYEKNKLIALNGLWRTDKLYEVGEIKTDQLPNHPISEKLLKLLMDQKKIYQSNITFCATTHLRMFLLKPLLSHSCFPNTISYTFGRQSALFVTRPVKSGEQITCTYGALPELHPKKIRQKHTWEHFSFKCICEACIGDWPQQFPRKDRRFVDPKDASELKPTDAVKQFKKNCQYIDKHIQNMPCFEVLKLKLQNDILIRTMGGNVG